ncbi:AtpZ/AtpI family protein [Breznakia pachnodae]|uniref:F0F1-type ATP synthase assembly protein I n=1 Tax=Breznakia pachnodae TaxID=265178 RepID=A0ABU0E140_9FIRM|nr:AtpZ/AtpI family protein [Breznakia pachnodae]MDQ0360598.1 F0F1-type ATP synthase assembly protein I [Breznakia pachnodae]
MSVMRFIGRMIAGVIIAVLLGNYIDEYLHTTPIVMMVLLLYVIIGSLYKLIKDAGDDHE